MSQKRTPIEEMGTQLERLQSQFENVMRYWMTDPEMLSGASQSVAVDVLDQGEEFLVTVDLPGFEREEIDVHLRDRTLTITVEREDTTETSDDGVYIRQERTYESARRTVQLPEAVHAEDAEATYKNGVLTLTVPKREPTTDDGTQITVS